MICLLLAVYSLQITNAQAPPSPNPVKLNQDSLQKAYYDSVNNLIKTKLSITAPVIEAAVDNYKSRVSAKEYESTGKAIDAFIETLMVTWLEAYRKEEEAKKTVSTSGAIVPKDKPKK